MPRRKKSLDTHEIVRRHRITLALEATCTELMNMGARPSSGKKNRSDIERMLDACNEARIALAMDELLCDLYVETFVTDKEFKNVLKLNGIRYLSELVAKPESRLRALGSNWEKTLPEMLLLLYRKYRETDPRMSTPSKQNDTGWISLIRPDEKKDE